ncbi:TauD/TfdA family dioxygenase [Bradyrhizobium jicamae]|uniref:TauD/TfdA family dioxygenase n=1 Tax=Bradyrhizobium jicamae TaxID=280332 RepID=UPI001BA69791|nr:TauD/TfdA family dioxygenase [Bradyrhizobium jicamae]MBR0754955.1 TauD/TfdA family dioxygenase [Bradyrhizobium jicamae]
MILDLSQLKREGYLLLSEVDEGDLAGTAQELGPLRVDPRSPEPIRDIRPQDLESAKQNTLSSRYGTGAFPFHTDAAHWDHPAQYLGLYCVDPGEGRRATMLIDSRVWALDDDEQDLACRALWATGHVRPRLCTFAKETGSGLEIRYDMDCMKPMTREAHSLKALLEARIQDCKTTQIQWKPKDLLIIDNRRMLHARASSARPDTGRLLKRMLIGGDRNAVLEL